MCKPRGRTVAMETGGVGSQSGTEGEAEPGPRSSPLRLSMCSHISGRPTFLLATKSTGGFPAHWVPGAQWSGQESTGWILVHSTEGFLRKYDSNDLKTIDRQRCLIECFSILENGLLYIIMDNVLIKIQNYKVQLKHNCIAKLLLQFPRSSK